MKSLAYSLLLIGFLAACAGKSKPTLSDPVVINDLITSFQKLSTSKAAKQYATNCSKSKEQLGKLAKELSKKSDARWLASAKRATNLLQVYPAMDEHTHAVYAILRAWNSDISLNGEKSERVMDVVKNLPEDCGFVHANALAIGLAKRSTKLRKKEKSALASAMEKIATQPQAGLLTEIAINQYSLEWLMNAKVLAWNEAQRTEFAALRKDTDKSINEFRKSLPTGRYDVESFINSICSEYKLSIDILQRQRELIVAKK